MRAVLFAPGRKKAGRLNILVLCESVFFYEKILFETGKLCYTVLENGVIKEADVMKHIKTLSTRDLKESMKKGGCGECQTSCQSACKTYCTVGNQSCEKLK